MDRETDFVAKRGHGGYRPDTGWEEDMAVMEKKARKVERLNKEDNNGVKKRRVHFRRLAKQRRGSLKGVQMKSCNDFESSSSSSSSCGASLDSQRGEDSQSKYILEVREPDESKLPPPPPPPQVSTTKQLPPLDCCKIPMEESQCSIDHHHRHNRHHHHHDHHHNKHKRHQHHHHGHGHSHQAPIIVVPPINDESTRCNCQNCQFFSGWFCCIPLAALAFAAVLITWLVLKNRPAEEWARSQQEETFYLPTTPMVEATLVERLNDTIRVGPPTDPWYKTLG